MEPEGAAPAVVGDHPFVARPWWKRCEQCGLAMPSHFEVEDITYEAMLAEIASHEPVTP